MVRVGIIGCGSISIYRHIPEYHNNPDSKIAGYYDPIKERALKQADIYGGMVYASIEEMLADTSIDAVSVCTSNKYHASVTIAALNAGKHVLCEKPMAVSLEDARKMIRESEKTGKLLMIGHNQRFAPAHAKAKHILESGEMGRILSFKASFGHGGPETWSQDKSKNTWFFKAEDAFFGVMGDLGVHKADLVRWLINEEISEVKSYIATLDKKGNDGKLINVDDNAICLLKSESGVIGTINVSWTHYGCEDNSTEIYCSEGIIRLNSNPEFPVELIKKNGEKAYFLIGQIQTNDQQTNSGVIDAFIDSIINGRKPPIPGEEGLEAIKIISACIESSKTGQSVRIEKEKV